MFFELTVGYVLVDYDQRGLDYEVFFEVTMGCVSIDYGLRFEINTIKRVLATGCGLSCLQ